MSPMPAYARVDVIWNNKSELVVSELELIEPELWFRLNPHAAILAKYINGLIAKRFSCQTFLNPIIYKFALNLILS